MHNIKIINNIVNVSVSQINAVYVHKLNCVINKVNQKIKKIMLIMTIYYIKLIYVIKKKLNVTLYLSDI